MDDDELLLLLLLFLKRRSLLKKAKPKRKHKIRVRKIFQERTILGEYNRLIKELRLHDHEFFFKQFRMSPSRFEDLLKLVGPSILKSSTRREALSPDERLCITMRFLVTGDSFVSIGHSYRVGLTTVSNIVFETCQAIWINLLEKNYMKFPKSAEEWIEIAKGFKLTWNFPNCLGAIDGKHIVMQAPSRSGSSYFNYKKTHSIVLMAVCNHRYEFILVDIGDSGRESDGSVFAASHIGHALSTNSLKSPYVFVGDEAFPLKVNLIKPYPRTALDEEKRICNYRISSARRIIENTFGIMASRFRVFRRPTVSSPEKVAIFTKAAVALHNFLMIDNGFPKNYESELTNGDGQVHSAGLIDIPQTGSNNYGCDAKLVRDNFCRYFNSPEGSVHWQWDYIHRIIDRQDT